MLAFYYILLMQSISIRTFYLRSNYIFHWGTSSCRQASARQQSPCTFTLWAQQQQVPQLLASYDCVPLQCVYNINDYALSCSWKELCHSKVLDTATYILHTCANGATAANFKPSAAKGSLQEFVHAKSSNEFSETLRRWQCMCTHLWLICFEVARPIWVLCIIQTCKI